MCHCQMEVNKYTPYNTVYIVQRTNSASLFHISSQYVYLLLFRRVCSDKAGVTTDDNPTHDLSDRYERHEKYTSEHDYCNVHIPSPPAAPQESVYENVFSI